MKWPWTRKPKPDYIEWRARARLPASADDWRLVLGREPRSGEPIEDMFLEAIVRIVKKKP